MLHLVWLLYVPTLTSLNCCGTNKESCSLFCVADGIFIFSTVYTWFMITLIAIDRHLIITKNPSVHEKYVTMKIICYYVIVIVGLEVT